MRDDLRAFIDDPAALSAADAQALDAYLMAHPEAARELRDDRLTHACLSRLLSRARQDFTARVLGQITSRASTTTKRRRAATGPHRPRSGRSRWRWAELQPLRWQLTATSAALVMIMVTVAVVLARPQLGAHWHAGDGHALVVHDGAAVALADGAWLQAGEVMEVDASGGSLVVSEGSTIAMDAGSRCSWRPHDGLQLNLERGAVQVVASHQRSGRHLQVRTPQALITVIGTQFRVVAGPGATEVHVRSGIVHCERPVDARTADVHADEQLRIAAQGALAVRPEVAAGAASELWVDPQGSADGNGTPGRPFATIAQALARARPEDAIVLADGRYRESVTLSGGSADHPQVLRAAHAGKATVSGPDTVLMITGSEVQVLGIQWSGEDATEPVVEIGPQVHAVEIRACQVSHGNGGISCNAADRITIAGCVISANLGSQQTVANAGITVRGTHQVLIASCQLLANRGDAVALDYGGWDEVAISRCDIDGGTPPQPGAALLPRPWGVNGVNTKQQGGVPRGHLRIEDCRIHGFGQGAGLHLRQNCEIEVLRCVIAQCLVGIRLRGSEIDPVSSLPTPSVHAQVVGVVLHHLGTGIRYEDGVEWLHISHCSFGRELGTVLEEAGLPSPAVSAHDNLVLGPMPRLLAAQDNVSCEADAFLDVEHDEYRLRPGASAPRAVPPCPETALLRPGLDARALVAPGAYPSPP